MHPRFYSLCMAPLVFAAHPARHHSGNHNTAVILTIKGTDVKHATPSAGKKKKKIRGETPSYPCQWSSSTKAVNKLRHRAKLHGGSSSWSSTCITIIIIGLGSRPLCHTGQCSFTGCASENTLCTRCTRTGKMLQGPRGCWKGARLGR